MCACEGSFVCAACKGTPFDPRYFEDAPEPLTADEFEALTVEPYDGRRAWV